MMDQILAGVPQSPPAQPAYRDQQTSSGTNGAEGGDSFQDYVSKAGQQEGQQYGRDGRDNGVNENTPADDAATEAAALKAATPTVDAARRNVQDSAESRIRLALLKQSQKAAVPAETGKTVDAEKALAKVLDAAKQIAQKATQDVAATPVLQDAAATPSEELSLLLGLKPAKETSAKSTFKTDAEKADAKDEKTALHTDRKAEILLAGAENAAPVKGDNNNDAHGKDNAADEAVRLVSADGRGRPVDISLTRTGTDGVTDSDKKPNAAKFDTATVIEARRYLGFSADVNTTVLTDAIKSDATWTEALSHVNRAELALEGDTVTEVNTLKLQMSPGDLGNMVASLKLKGDELTVEVRVDTIEAYRQLSADQDGIVKALQDQGFNIDTVTVQLNPTERTEANADQDLTRQGQGRKDGQGDQAGRNDNARQGAQESWIRNDDAGNSTTADGRTDPSRTGDIYL